MFYTTGGLSMEKKDDSSVDFDVKIGLSEPQKLNFEKRRQPFNSRAHRGTFVPACNVLREHTPRSPFLKRTKTNGFVRNF